MVEIGKTTVTLYIAGEAPKQPDSSSSSQTAPPAGDKRGHAASGIARHHGAVRRRGRGRRNRRRGHARRLTPPHAQINAKCKLIAPRNQRFRALLRGAACALPCRS